MKKIPDIGTLIVLALTFLLIFYLVQLFLEKIGYPFYELAYALIAACAWLYLPHSEEE